MYLLRLLSGLYKIFTTLFAYKCLYFINFGAFLINFSYRIRNTNLVAKLEAKLEVHAHNTKTKTCLCLCFFSSVHTIHNTQNPSSQSPAENESGFPHMRGEFDFIQ